jgi:hypothetical protein
MRFGRQKGRRVCAHVCRWIPKVTHIRMGFTACCMTVFAPLSGSLHLSALQGFLWAQEA